MRTRVFDPHFARTELPEHEIELGQTVTNMPFALTYEKGGAGIGAAAFVHKSNLICRFVLKVPVRDVNRNDAIFFNRAPRSRSVELRCRKCRVVDCKGLQGTS